MNIYLNSFMQLCEDDLQINIFLIPLCCCFKMISKMNINLTSFPILFQDDLQINVYLNSIVLLFQECFTNEHLQDFLHVSYSGHFTCSMYEVIMQMNLFQTRTGMYNLFFKILHAFISNTSQHI